MKGSKSNDKPPHESRDRFSKTTLRSNLVKRTKGLLIHTPVTKLHTKISTGDVKMMLSKDTTKC